MHFYASIARNSYGNSVCPSESGRPTVELSRPREK